MAKSRDRVLSRNALAGIRCFQSVTALTPKPAVLIAGRNALAGIRCFQSKVPVYRAVWRIYCRNALAGIRCFQSDCDGAVPQAQSDGGS